MQPAKQVLTSVKIMTLPASKGCLFFSCQYLKPNGHIAAFAPRDPRFKLVPKGFEETKLVELNGNGIIVASASCEFCVFLSGAIKLFALISPGD